MKIYLDTCVWCRPFDEPSERVRKEEEAFFEILEKASKWRVEIITSIVLDYEVAQIDDPQKRDDVLKSISLFESYKVAEIPKSVRREIMNTTGLRPTDATHLAVAIQHSEYFISVDDEILKRGKRIERQFGIKVRNPIEFIEEVK